MSKNGAQIGTNLMLMKVIHRQRVVRGGNCQRAEQTRVPLRNEAWNKPAFANYRFDRNPMRL
jgi:hypothetical protein